MSLAGLCASVEDVDTLGRFLATVGLWTRETSVSSHDTTKPSLTPAELRGSLFLHALHGVERVLASGWTVAHNLTGSLHHVNT